MFKASAAPWGIMTCDYRANDELRQMMERGAGAGISGTFLFADLAGYTALTEAHGDVAAADVAGEFAETVRVLLADHRAEDIKSIGDELMIRGRDAADAVRLALRIVHEIGARHGHPSVRVGMHTGPAVARGNDWFGATVNIAARVAALAAGGEVLLTDATRAEAVSLDGVRLIARGEHVLRNVTIPVALFAAVPAGREASGFPIDPVCRMAVDPQRGAGALLHRGSEYRFCSLRCAQAFAAEPERYVT